MRYIVLLMALAVTSGCGSRAYPPVARPFPREATISADFTQVWDATIDIFGERFWPIANMDRASGFIASDWMSSITSPEYLDCGVIRDRYGEYDQRIDPTGLLNIVVREVESGTVVLRVNTLWRSQGQNECVSTGALEREIHDAVTEQLTRSP